MTLKASLNLFSCLTVSLISLYGLFHSANAGFARFCSETADFEYKASCFKLYTQHMTYEESFQSCKNSAKTYASVFGIPMVGRLAHLKSEELWINISSNVPSIFSEKPFIGLMSEEPNEQLHNMPTKWWWMADSYIAESRADSGWLVNMGAEGRVSLRGNDALCFFISNTWEWELGRCDVNRSSLCEYYTVDGSSASALCDSPMVMGHPFGQSCFKHYRGGSNCCSCGGLRLGSAWDKAFAFCSEMGTTIGSYVNGRLAFARDRQSWEEMALYINTVVNAELRGSPWMGLKGTGTTIDSFYWAQNGNLSDASNSHSQLEESLLDWYGCGAEFTLTAETPGCVKVKSANAWIEASCDDENSFVCEYVVQIDPCLSNPCQNGGTCTANTSSEDTFECYCPTNMHGRLCHDLSCVTLHGNVGPFPRNCADIKTADPDSRTGRFTIQLGDCIGYMTVSCCRDVYCDMDTLGGGWTILQHRFDGSVDFNKGWIDYQKGFGNVNGEHWLGLETMRLLSLASSHSMETYQLLVEVQAHDKTCLLYSLYSNFSLGGTCYTLGIGNIIEANAGSDMLMGHNGCMFTTLDKDNDALPGQNCALVYSGGWWFSNCFGGIYFNGNYCDTGCTGHYSMGIVMKQARGLYYSFKASAMKLRPAGFSLHDSSVNNWCRNLSFAPCPQGSVPMSLSKPSIEKCNQRYSQGIRNCHWGSWSSWAQCADPCGEPDKNIVNRIRQELPEVEGGMTCKGNNTETKKCNFSANSCQTGTTTAPTMTTNKESSITTTTIRITTTQAMEAAAKTPDLPAGLLPVKNPCSTLCGPGFQEWLQYPDFFNGIRGEKTKTWEIQCNLETCVNITAVCDLKLVVVVDTTSDESYEGFVDGLTDLVLDFASRPNYKLDYAVLKQNGFGDLSTVVNFEQGFTSSQMLNTIFRMFTNTKNEMPLDSVRQKLLEWQNNATVLAFLGSASLSNVNHLVELLKGIDSSVLIALGHNTAVSLSEISELTLLTGSEAKILKFPWFQLDDLLSCVDTPDIRGDQIVLKRLSANGKL